MQLRVCDKSSRHILKNFSNKTRLKLWKFINSSESGPIWTHIIWIIRHYFMKLLSHCLLGFFVYLSNNVNKIKFYSFFTLKLEARKHYLPVCLQRDNYFTDEFLLTKSLEVCDDNQKRTIPLFLALFDESSTDCAYC